MFDRKTKNNDLSDYIYAFKVQYAVNKPSFVHIRMYSKKHNLIYICRNYIHMNIFGINSDIKALS